MSTETVRRPTLVAGLAALCVVAFAANDAGATYGGLAFVALLGGAVLAVSTGLASREEPLAVFAASVLAPVGGVAVLAAAALSVADLPLLQGLLDPLVLLGLAAAGFGGVAAFTGGVGGGAVGRAFSVVVATTALPVVAGIAAVLTAVNASTGIFGQVGDLLGLLGRLVTRPTGGPVDVVVFVVVAAATARALAAGLDAAPVVELAPREYRDTAASATGTAIVVCLSIWRLFAVGWLVVFAGLVGGFGPRVLGGVPDPVVDAVGMMASSSAVRFLLLATIVVSLATYAALRVGRLVTGDQRESLRRVAPTAGGGVLAVTVGVVFAGRLVAEVQRSVPDQAASVVERAAEVFGEPALALTALVVPLVGLAALLLAFAALGRLRAIPQRAAPAAVASAGLVLAGAAAGVQNASPGFVFGLVAAGMVAWDAGEHGVGLAAELGRTARTARVELVHVAVSVGVGVLAYYAALELHGLTAGVASTGSAAAGLVAFVAAGVGLVALVAALAD